MKRFVFSILIAIGASFIAPQLAQAQTGTNGYEVEVIYNRTDKTTTIVLYKDDVEVGRTTNPATP